jgi:hypothetical protein
MLMAEQLRTRHNFLSASMHHPLLVLLLVMMMQPRRLGAFRPVIPISGDLAKTQSSVCRRREGKGKEKEGQGGSQSGLTERMVA